MKFLRRLLLCLLAFLLTSSPLVAGPLDKAEAAFGKGDFKKAGKLAGSVLKKSKKPSDKAEALVLQGAAAMKQGKSGKSRFKKALKLDPNVTLPSVAEKDKKIRKAFASVQKKSGNVSSGGTRTSSDKLTKTSKRSNQKSFGNIMNYAPFGINSFMQGKTLTGVAFAGLQVGGLFLYINRKDAVATADKDAKSVIADAEKTGPNAVSSPEFLQFLDENDAFVKRANSEANLALGIAVAGYAFSLIDSFFDPMGTSTASLDSNVDKKVYAYNRMGSDFDHRKIDSSWKFDFQFVPSSQPGLILTAKSQF